MPEPFASIDTPEGIALEADPQIDPAGQALAPLPPVQPLVATAPRVPIPPSPPLPPTPMQDPKQKLLALAALGFALGAGRQSGMAQGAMHGLLNEQAQLHQDNLQRWQIQADEAKRQQQAAVTQQNMLDRANEAKVQQTFTNLRQDVLKAKDEESYQKTIGLYAGGLQAAGFRASPTQLMQQFPYSPPSDEQEITGKLKEYFTNDLVKSLPPEQKLAGAISFKRKGQLVQLPVQDALKRVGLDLPVNDADGNPVFSSIGKGPEAQQAIERAGLEFKTQFGRLPKPGDAKDNDWVMTRAHQFTDKKDPATEEMNRTLKGLQIQGDQLRNQISAQTLESKKQTDVTDLPITSPYYRYAQDLASGAMTLGQLQRQISARSGGGANVNALRAQIYNAAIKINPEFNAAQFEIGYNFAKSPKIQQQVSSINNVIAGVPDLLKASDQASRSGATILNNAILRGGVALGGKRYSNFMTARTAFADELSGALGYGSASDMSREMGFDMTNANLSPENFRSAIEEIVVPFVNRKKSSILGPMGPYGANPNLNVPPPADSGDPALGAAAAKLRSRGGR